MNISDRFLELLAKQLSSFENETEIEQIVVYIAKTKEGSAPSLEVVGQWPDTIKVLKPLELDRDLRAPSPKRRWYPLQEKSILLGVLRVERISEYDNWPKYLDDRFQATSMSLAQCLSLELESERLNVEIERQREQIGLMVHQLRNPLAALRTYAKLLMKKLGPENSNLSLVEGLLNEQEQLNKYVSALDDMSQVKLPTSDNGVSSLLLPPVFSNEKFTNLRTLLEPLIERALVTANLQGRNWIQPGHWPDWICSKRPLEEAVVAEIIANLLENAFRYSPQNASIGINFNNSGICVWDGGIPIKDQLREKIFEKGFRGDNNSENNGSGIGLALARELAEKLNGSLDLMDKPSDFNKELPDEGNAFFLELPMNLEIK